MADSLESVKTLDSGPSSNKERSAKQRTKRPDLQVYVPRGRRQQEPGQVIVDARISSVASSLSIEENVKPNSSSSKKVQGVRASDKVTVSRSKKSLKSTDVKIDRCQTDCAHNKKGKDDVKEEHNLKEDPLQQQCSVKDERFPLHNQKSNDMLMNDGADSSTRILSSELRSDFCRFSKSDEPDIASLEAGKDPVVESFCDGQSSLLQYALPDDSNHNSILDVSTFENTPNSSVTTSFQELLLHESFQDCDDHVVGDVESCEMTENDSCCQQNEVSISAVDKPADVHDDNTISRGSSPCSLKTEDPCRSPLVESEIVKQASLNHEIYDAQLSNYIDTVVYTTLCCMSDVLAQSAECSESAESAEVLEKKSLKLPDYKPADSEEVHNQRKKHLNTVIDASRCDENGGIDDDDDDDDWDHIFDESGEARNSELVPNLPAGKKSANDKKEVGIASTSYIDYYSFEAKDPDVSCIECGHLIEIYDFPATFQTCDLLAAFLEYKDRGFDVKWVDDTHAIGIFSSNIAANSVLRCFKNPLMKVRSIDSASRATKLKARRTSEFLQPYKARPETSASVARNLVAGALGLQNRVSREKRDEERRKLKEAKERKREVVKLKDEAWDGTLNTS